MLNKGYSQYRENSVFTASPEDLTLMLYNGLIKFILQAQMGLDEKDFEKCGNSIVRAEDIVTEFQSTLNKKYPISESLDLLYDYMLRRLIEANIKKDREILEEVLGMAKELRDTWTRAMKLSKQKSQQSQAVGQG